MLGKTPQIMVAFTVEQSWPSLQREVELPSARTRFIEQGEGFPVVLVHGLMAYSFSWRKNIPELARYYRVLAPDSAGCGYSGPLKNGKYGIEAWSRHLKEFADAMQLGRFHLIGTSAGGAVAIDFASHWPDRVEKLVLVAPVTPFSCRVRFLAAVYRGSRLPLPLMRLLIKNSQRLLPWIFRHRYYADQSRITRETIPGYLAPLNLETTVPMLRDSIRGWSPKAMLKQFPRLTMPTLLVWGVEDKLVPSACIPALQRALPNAELKLVEGSGHLPYEETPETFNEIILRFLLPSPPEP